MAQHFTLLLTLLFLVSCNRAETADLKLQTTKGEFRVDVGDLPSRIIQIANSLERLPANATPKQFKTALANSGLNEQSDWYKDCSHYWYLDENFETDPSRSGMKYVITITYWPQKDSILGPYDALIHRVSNDRSRECVWRIDWPLDWLGHPPW